MNLPMHMETTADPDTCVWIVGRDNVTGFLDSRFSPEMPFALRELLAVSGVRRVTISPGRVSITKEPDVLWRGLAADLNARIGDLGRNGELDLMDQLPRDETLRTAVGQLLDGELAGLTQSHGGRISISSVQGNTVSLLMEGACDNCPATAATVERHILGPLSPHFPGIRVRVVNACGPDSRRQRLPFFDRIGRRPTGGASGSVSMTT